MNLDGRFDRMTGMKRCFYCDRDLPEECWTPGVWRNGGYCRECMPKYNLLRNYGLTQDWLTSTLEQQHGGCLYCGTHVPGGKYNQWNVDHDHLCCPGKKSCGKCVRGLVCHACNIIEGYIKSDFQRFIAAVIRMAELNGGDE